MVPTRSCSCSVVAFLGRSDTASDKGSPDLGAGLEFADIPPANFKLHGLRRRISDPSIRCQIEVLPRGPNANRTVAQFTPQLTSGASPTQLRRSLMDISPGPGWSKPGSTEKPPECRRLLRERVGSRLMSCIPAWLTGIGTCWIRDSCRPVGLSAPVSGSSAVRRLRCSDQIGTRGRARRSVSARWNSSRQGQRCGARRVATPDRLTRRAGTEMNRVRTVRATVK
jgi:hypothetical protein